MEQYYATGNVISTNVTTTGGTTWNSSWYQSPTMSPTITAIPLTFTFTPTVHAPPSAAVLKQIERAKLSPHAALIGYRAWGVDHYPDGPILFSLNRRHLWIPYEALSADVCPEFGNSNGIHAARSISHLGKMGYMNQPIWGEVWLWGKIQHGENGFRAQYAYPKTLEGDHWFMDRLRLDYGL